jgi:hypothetical protein
MTATNLRITVWTDREGDATGYPARHPYVDLFWLPILGPSSTALLMRLNLYLDDDHEAWTFNLNDLGQELGLGTSESKHSPLLRAISRLIEYNLAKRSHSGTLAVRRVVGPLPPQYLSRLSPVWQDLHRHLTTRGRVCDPDPLATVP